MILGNSVLPYKKFNHYSRWLRIIALSLGCLSIDPNKAHAQKPVIDTQDKIRRAQSIILPKVVYIHVIGRSYDEGHAERQLWRASGIIISTDGYVVTNHHVVNQAQRVRVMLSDRRIYEATVIGSDRETDLGLLKLSTQKSDLPLPAAEFGNSDLLQTGDFVLAVGSPLGLARSVSLGIVNNPSQPFYNEFYRWIQTDAAINPGNSGGALSDLEGRVVGINTQIISGTGIGFAIPSNITQEIIRSLLIQGHVIRSSLGLTFQALRDFDRDSYIPGENGVLITAVEANSPAAQAGFKVGDILISAQGKATTALYSEEIPEIQRALAQLKPEQPIRFDLLRDNKKMTLTAIPKRRESYYENEEVFDATEWMFSSKIIRKEDAPLKYYLRPKGCFVAAIPSNGNASHSGLEKEDVLIKVDNHDIYSLDDLRQAYYSSLRKPPSERLILVSVIRKGRLRQIALDYRQPSSTFKE